ncbi:MAG: hypothetical protein H6969_12295 [Gammaproteobacteria bacterium]|nr:hypothetical protein [Gammaproteobacteria bacterium]
MDSPRDPNEEMIIVIVILATPVVLWWAFSGELVSLAFHVKLWELQVLTALGLGDVQAGKLFQAIRAALRAPDQVSFAHFAFGLDAVGRYGRIPVILGLLGLGTWLLLGHPAERFRRRFDLYRLAETVGEQWPYALHALRRNNLAMVLDHPQWGLALSARELIERHHLLNKKHKEGDEEKASVLHPERTQQILIAQLGAPWAAGDAVSLPAQALAGLFAQRVASLSHADDKTAAHLKKQTFAALKTLALAAANHHEGDFLPPAAVYQRIIADTAPFVVQAEPLIRQHTYTQTVLLRLLEEARQGGVLPPALFNWLKGVDRPLWYALSSLGRRVAFAEALGALAHYQAERAAGSALPPPCVEAAVAALQASVAPPPEPDSP